MDAVDLAILREMTSAHVILFGGMNPRLSPEQMARRVGLDPSSIRARIRGWERSGFLTGFDVVPNLRLLGARVFVGGALVPDSSARARFIDDLALVDGVVSLFDHVGGWVGITLAVERPGVLERRVDLVKRMPGVAETEAFFEGILIPPVDPPSPLEWRVIRALRGSPSAAHRDLAREIGVSVNTFSARYNALARRSALWSVPNLDFTKYTGGALTRVILRLAPGMRASAVGAGLALTFQPPVFLQPPEGPAAQGVTIADMLVHVDAVAQVEDLAAALRDLEGIQDFEIVFPRSYRFTGRWVDEQLAHAAPPGAPNA